jgi:membrane-associated PAP2 superfamily phosphatase
MNRNGLIVALVVAVLFGVTFGLYPELDLKVSALFFDAARWNALSAWSFLRNAALWLIALLAAPAGLALAVKLIRPRTRLLIPGRAVVFLLATLALGPGLLTNVILKDYWGRARPLDVVQFGGKEAFVPRWDWRSDCYKNCSFVAGEPSGAFWTLAPAALTPPAWRPFATGAAIMFGIGLGVLRMSVGAHFFTDVVFAGVFTFLLIWTPVPLAAYPRHRPGCGTRHRTGFAACLVSAQARRAGAAVVFSAACSARGWRAA